MNMNRDIDPQDIDPEANRPYAGYSSPSLDTSFHDSEMDVDDEEAARSACDIGDRLSLDLRDEPEGDDNDEFYSDDPRAMQGIGL